MIARVKGDLDNPVALNGFFENLPQGVAIDNTFA